MDTVQRLLTPLFRQPIKYCVLILVIPIFVLSVYTTTQHMYLGGVNHTKITATIALDADTTVQLSIYLPLPAANVDNVHIHYRDIPILELCGNDTMPHIVEC
jgi:hypothetical protein